MRVLVVDDDDSLRHVVRDLLLEIGCSAVSFTSCDEVVAHARACSPKHDLILLDLEPDELVRTRRRLADALPRMPVAVVSNGDYETTVETAFAVLRAARHDAKRLTARMRRLERWNDELMRVVGKDPLTGLANRRHFDAQLQTEWRRAVREQGPLSLVMLDVDYFHAFNERYGHLGGDACLRRVAQALALCLQRPCDAIARYGGEEIVVLLPGTGARGAFMVAERLRACVEQLEIPHEASRCSSVVTASAGVSTTTPRPGTEHELLVASADVALFRAKHEGRNRVCTDPGTLMTLVCHGRARKLGHGSRRD